LRSFWSSCSNNRSCLNNWSNLGNNWGSCSNNLGSLSNNWSSLSNNWSSLSNNWNSLCISDWNSLSNNRSCLSNNRSSFGNNRSSLSNNWSNSNLSRSFFFNGSKVSSFSSCNFRSIHNRSSLSRWKISGSYSEACTISNVFNSLKNSISVNILVCSSNNSISSFDLLSDGVWIIVTKTILANLILSMILGSCDSICSLNNRNSLCNNRSNLSHRSSLSISNRSSLGNNRSSLSYNWSSLCYNSLSNWSVFIGLSIWKISI